MDGGVAIKKGRKQTQETDARKAECIRIHVEENRGVSYISKRLKMNKALVRKWLVKAAVYKVGGRSSAPVDRRCYGVVFEDEWRGVKRWDECAHWGILSKTCPYCKKHKAIDDFYSLNRAYCKTCHNMRTAQIKAKNPNKYKEARKRWVKDNIEHVRKERKRYYRAIKGLPEDHERKPIPLAIRIHSKHAKAVRRTFNHWVNNAKDHHYTYLAGCTRGFLRQWIERKFEKGMSWNDRTTWQIDHIIPVAKFDLSTREGRAKCFHYTNLQPLWNDDNHRKGASIVTCQPELTICITSWGRAA